MLERVQERSWLHALGLQDRTHLRGAQKALAQWAIVDDYNNILDLSCQDTRLLRFLSQKYSLRACGIADDPEHARALRLELPDAENAPAFDGTFQREAARVLKPGGQLLIAVQGAPEPLCKVGELLGLCDGDDHVSPAQLLKSMEDAGLEDVSWRLAQPMVCLAMGWRRR